MGEPAQWEAWGMLTCPRHSSDVRAKQQKLGLMLRMFPALEEDGTAAEDVLKILQERVGEGGPLPLRLAGAWRKMNHGSMRVDPLLTRFSDHPLGPLLRKLRNAGIGPPRLERRICRLFNAKKLEELMRYVTVEPNDAAGASEFGASLVRCGDLRLLRRAQKLGLLEGEPRECLAAIARGNAAMRAAVLALPEGDAAPREAALCPITPPAGWGGAPGRPWTGCGPPGRNRWGRRPAPTGPGPCCWTKPFRCGPTTSAAERGTAPSWFSSPSSATISTISFSSGSWNKRALLFRRP